MATFKYLTAPIKTDKMPPGVPFIVGNEAAERFSFYGMNAILVPFMTHHLLTSSGSPDLMTPEQAKSWYHLFGLFAFGLCFVGAFLADAVLGKYRTILYISLFYCAGHLALAIDHTRTGLAIGLTLIAFGAGGIKPCVSANVGDQFGHSNQHLLNRVYNWFYFSINTGSAVATLSIPWLLEEHGPDIAFGTPGILMGIATVVFWLGRKKFVHLPPVGIKNYFAELSQAENLKALGNLFLLVPFASMFWALWQQNFSSWVVQAEKLDRHLFGVEWQPAQIQTVNPLFILTLLPVFSYVVYPALEKVVKLTPLRKIGLGFFVTAFAFFIVAMIQVWIDAGQTPSILWQILAFAVLTCGEIMVSVTHLEFAYTQAPKKMKSLVMCTYLVAISLGNGFTSAVNFFIQNPDGTVKLSGATYFFFFVAVLVVTGLLFVFFARFYKGRTYIQDDAEAQPA